MKSVNRISSIAAFFGIHITNFVKEEKTTTKPFFPFCNQFRGSGKTRFAGIISDKTYIEKHLPEILPVFGLHGNASPHMLKQNGLFLKKLFGEKANIVINLTGKKMCEEILKKIVSLIEPTPVHTINAESEDFVEDLKKKMIKNDEESFQQFCKVKIWCVDEVCDDGKNVFRKIWDQCFSLHRTNSFKNSDTLHLFHFSGNFSFEGLKSLSSFFADSSIIIN